MDFLDDKIADRLDGINFGKDRTLYKFDKIKKSKVEAKLNKPGLNLIDMGVGEPRISGSCSKIFGKRLQA
jgi:LL-diaminopimelate aminotransferase